MVPIVVVYEDSPVQQLYRFRNLVTDPDDIVIPARPETRRVTDRNYTILFVLALMILVPFLVYTLMYADIQNLAGYDYCGNFCGYKNKKYDEWNCTGQDFRDKRYLVTFLSTEPNKCVENCQQSDYSCKDNLKDNLAIKFKKLMGNIEEGSWVIIVSLLTCCALCLGMLLLFKYAVDFMVWSLLIGFISLHAFATIYFWNEYLKHVNHSSETSDKYESTVVIHRNDNADEYLKATIMSGIFTIFFSILLICMIKRVKLIIQLFKESAKAIFDIPGMIYFPFLIFVPVILHLIVFNVLFFYIITAGKLQDFGNHLEYNFDGSMIFTMIYNIFIFLWIATFISGAQYMIIAGAVSAWFFTRDKNYLDRPLWTSFMNFIKFHLGTVFLGSLILTIVTFMKILHRALQSNRRTSWIFECCCNAITEYLKLYSKNAYIQTAMHGQPFSKSGRRALDLLVSNIGNFITVNSIGDSVLVMAQILMFVINSFLGFAIAKATGNENWVEIGSISLLFSLFMVGTFFNIFEATVDTMYICFCEDSIINDGMARPYCMTKGLRQMIENCKTTNNANN